MDTMKRMHTSIFNPIERFAPGGMMTIDGNGLPVPNVDRMEANPFVCFVDDDKKFSQEDVDAMMNKRFAKEKAAQEKLEADLKAAQEKAAKEREEFEARLSEIETKGTSEAERQAKAIEKRLSDLEKANQAMATERDEWKAKAEQASQSIVMRDKSERARAALTKAGALPEALDQATRLFLDDGKAELAEDGSMMFTIGGVPITDPAKAAAKWLETSPHFVKGNTNGTHRPGSNPGGHLSVDQMDKMATGSLLEAGLGSEPKS